MCEIEVCPAGRYFNGGAGPASCSNCPAGTYSSGAASAASCTVCSAATPYSTSGASSCTSCTTGCDAAGSSYGRYACPGTDWTVWYDTTGLETVNSCVKYYSDAMLYPQSRDACVAAASGGHLLSSRSVRVMAPQFVHARVPCCGDRWHLLHISALGVLE